MPCGIGKSLVTCITDNCYSTNFDYIRLVGIAERVVCWKCGEEYDMTPYGLLEVRETKNEGSRVIASSSKQETWGERKRRLNQT